VTWAVCLLRSTLTIFVLFYKLLHIVIQLSAGRVLGSHDVASFEIIVSNVNDLDLLGIGSLDFLSQLRTGNISVRRGERHARDPFARDCERCDALKAKQLENRQIGIVISSEVSKLSDVLKREEHHVGSERQQAARNH